MEPDSLTRPGGATPGNAARGVAAPPTEWRALARLRERVEAAVREVERLRADNAALAARVGELQDALGDDGPGLALPGGQDPDVLRARVQGFIDAIDAVLADAPGDAGTDAGTDAADGPPGAP